MIEHKSMPERIAARGDDLWLRPPGSKRSHAWRRGASPKVVLDVTRARVTADFGVLGQVEIDVVA